MNARHLVILIQGRVFAGVRNDKPMLDDSPMLRCIMVKPGRATIPRAPAVEDRIHSWFAEYGLPGNMTWWLQRPSSWQVIWRRYRCCPGGYHVTGSLRSCEPYKLSICGVGPALWICEAVRQTGLYGVRNRICRASETRVTITKAVIIEDYIRVVAVHVLNWTISYFSETITTIFHHKHRKSSYNFRLLK
jgi:hypothetical protein